MNTVPNEYVGEHRPEIRPKRLDLRAYASIMEKLASAKRGVPNESPRHSASVFNVLRWRTVAELQAAQDESC